MKNLLVKFKDGNDSTVWNLYDKRDDGKYLIHLAGYKQIIKAVDKSEITPV